MALQAVTVPPPTVTVALTGIRRRDRPPCSWISGSALLRWRITTFKFGARDSTGHDCHWLCRSCRERRTSKQIYGLRGPAHGRRRESCDGPDRGHWLGGYLETKPASELEAEALRSLSGSRRIPRPAVCLPVSYPAAPTWTPAGCRTTSKKAAGATGAGWCNGATLPAGARANRRRRLATSTAVSSHQRLALAPGGAATVYYPACRMGAGPDESARQTSRTCSLQLIKWCCWAKNCRKTFGWFKPSSGRKLSSMTGSSITFDFGCKAKCKQIFSLQDVIHLIIYFAIAAKDCSRSHFCPLPQENNCTKHISFSAISLSCCTLPCSTALTPAGCRPPRARRHMQHSGGRGETQCPAASRHRATKSRILPTCSAPWS